MKVWRKALILRFHSIDEKIGMLEDFAWEKVIYGYPHMYSSLSIFT